MLASIIFIFTTWALTRAYYMIGLEHYKTLYESEKFSSELWKKVGDFEAQKYKNLKEKIRKSALKGKIKNL